ncbi:thioredoxin family protein [Flavobacterium restrictum]|uniref:Thioredoxin family protein n=1 Tax=Flavobacterium restrictum TaxID=2594428 RepID=A0A553E1Q2_9FLAO|nr:thioredoxin family protein [Flavobacterium restrictum]TRX38987.1 thioredoxin family protein [Flavobacterium restrictum]
MSKFGELINARIPVLIDFYTDWNESSVAMHPVIKDVAAALGDKAKVIRIDVDKNQELAEALRIKGLPTLMIYKEGLMIWRQSGELDANTIIGLVQEQI